VFEPTHGSAPKYAGQYKVNPIATILASKMMVHWLGETAMAQKLEGAVAAVIAEGKVRTYTGGSSSTLDMEAIAAKRDEMNMRLDARRRRHENAAGAHEPSRAWTPTRRPCGEGNSAHPVIDIHIHIAAKNEPGCKVSRELESETAFIYMLLADRVKRSALRRDFDGTIRDHILGALAGAPSVDYGVVLALDAAYGEDGRRLEKHSHLVVTNEYVRNLAKANPKMLVGASVHPNRGPAEGRDELERCLDDEPPAALLKLLPNSQVIDVGEPRHDWFYEVLAERGVPLLCHTGPENTPGPHTVDDFSVSATHGGCR
jgi:hypothetical protein